MASTATDIRGFLAEALGMLVPSPRGLEWPALVFSKLSTEFRRFQRGTKVREATVEVFAAAEFLSDKGEHRAANTLRKLGATSFRLFKSESDARVRRVAGRQRSRAKGE